MRRHRRRGSGGEYCESVELKVSPGQVAMECGENIVSFEVWRVKMTSDGWNVTYQHMQLE